MHTHKHIRTHTQVFLDANKLNADEMMKRVRALTLCSMGVAKKVLTYDEVQQELKLVSRSVYLQCEHGEQCEHTGAV